MNEQQTDEELIASFSKVFKGIGKLKNTYVRLHIDDSVAPVVQPVLRIPFHLRKQVSEELDNLESQGIIEKVNGPTTWVSPLVIAPNKNGSVRLCVDMRMPNKAILRERHITVTGMPTVTIGALEWVEFPSTYRYSSSLLLVTLCLVWVQFQLVVYV